jgi:predicted transcriptional regulator
MSRMTGFTVRLEKDVYDAVRVLAWVTDRSLNEVVVAAVTAYVLAQPTSAVIEQAQQAYERFQATLDRLRDE